MRILQINSVYGFGSTGKIVENIHRSILENGNQSYVIYGRGEKVVDPNVFKIGNLIEQATDLAITRIFNRHGQTNFVATHMIINKIKEINPDIVHLHNIHGYYINFPRLLNFLNKSSIKVVWLLHDPWIISGSSADVGALEYKWEKPVNYLELTKLSKEYPKHSKWSSKRSVKNYQIKKNLLRQNDITFVAPSKWLAQIIDDSYLGSSNIQVIHNGININQFRNIETKSRNNTIVILGVASIWEKRKGLYYFNKLAEDLDNNFDIILVGKLSSDSGTLHSRIKHIDRTESVDELVELYNQADIFVNTTLFDNFPTVNLEALACGTPVITFDTGGSGESITSSTGKIVEKGNYSQLLHYLLEITKKNKRISSNCIENSKNYSIENMIGSYLKLYQNMLVDKKE